MLRWMKVIVLLAGGLGVLAFFLPYYTFETDREYVPASAYHLTVGFPDHAYDYLAYEVRTRCQPDDLPCMESEDLKGAELYHIKVPFYFWTAATFLLVGILSIWRKRMSIPAGLFALAASMFAIGLWLNEINHDWMTPHSHPAIGATLLGIAGLIAIGPSFAVLYWREPDPVPLFKIRVPMARVVKR
ncbi:MAG TPA: hypothetical protein VL326_35805 [Kofleriaceae bacterium]|nr:hypothetical protein [Kofleriaceae bacterium]